MRTRRALTVLGVAAVSQNALRFAAWAVGLGYLRARMPEMFDGRLAAASVAAAIEQVLDDGAAA